MDGALVAVSLLIAHVGFHGSRPLAGPVADLVFLAGSALLLVAAWLVVHRTGR